MDVKIDENPDAVLLPVPCEPPLAVGLPDRHGSRLIRSGGEVRLDDGYASRFPDFFRPLPEALKSVVVDVEMVRPSMRPRPRDRSPRLDWQIDVIGLHR